MNANQITEDTARALAYACGVGRFERRGYAAKACAQANLSGRTHYADDDTLRFFHARILHAWPECEGLILTIVESVAADPDNRSRGFRFVAFDIFGTVIERPGIESLHKTSRAAEKALDAWLAGFDVVAHYRAAMTERAQSFERGAASLRDGAAALESVPT